MQLMRKLEMLTNFSWLIENVLAGSGQVGGWGYDEQLQSDLDSLCELGIKSVISLTESPLQTDLMEASDMAYFHLPIPDMHPPTLQDIIAFVQYVEKSLAEERPVLVHCSAGLGRTGTMLASYLVDKGSNTANALAQVRAMRPGSVETPDQELAVYDYEVYRGTNNVSS